MDSSIYVRMLKGYLGSLSPEQLTAILEELEPSLSDEHLLVFATVAREGIQRRWPDVTHKQHDTLPNFSLPSIYNYRIE